MPRLAVRVLHTGLCDVGRRLARTASAPNRRRDRRGDRRQPVPLHGLRVDPSRSASRRGALAMTTRWFGERVQRAEDDRLLRGKGRFTDDIDDGALESVLVRSPYAHARIRSIEVGAARMLPGVFAVYTAKDLPFGETDLPILIPHPNLTHGRTQRCLASEVVRYAGEAVAVVVAADRAIAEDSVELVEVDYEQLAAVITPAVSPPAEPLAPED